MTPEQMTQHLTHARVEGDRVIARFTEKTPEAIEALRSVKAGILLLEEAAAIARCAEPLHVLVHEFRQDLEQMAAGAWTAATVAEAIRTIGPGYGWAFKWRQQA